MNSLVSVIVFANSDFESVRPCLETMQAQTWKNTQTIVIGGEASHFAGEPGLVHLPGNCASRAVAYNRALPHVKGEFLALLEPGAAWQPEFLSASLIALHTLDVDFVFSNWTVRDGQNQEHMSPFESFYHWWDFPESELDGWRSLPPQPARAMYLDSCMSPMSSLVLRTSAFSFPWRERLHFAQLWAFLLERILTVPTRSAFTLKRLWTDSNPEPGARGLPPREFLRKLKVEDFCLIRNQLRSALTVEEYSRLSADIAHSQAVLSLDSLLRRDPRSAATDALGLFKRAFQGLVHSPGHFRDRFLKLSPRTNQVLSALSFLVPNPPDEKDYE